MEGAIATGVGVGKERWPGSGWVLWEVALQ